MGALGIAVVLNWYTSRWITRPIYLLSEASKALSYGQLERQVGISGAKEIAVLSTAFNRLLDNSLKFTDRGQVILKASAIAYSPAETNSMAKQTIRFEIKDNGVGIAKDELEKIFQPFEQVGDREKYQRGIGLGLAIGKQIIQLMNSKLQVKSKLHEGSTFYFDATFLVIT